MNSKNDLTSGNVFGKLAGFVIPFLFASFMQAFYSAVDMWTVGHFSQSADLAAVNVGAQVTQILIGVIIGLSMGTTVRIAYGVGARKPERATAAVGNSILIFSVAAVVLTPFMFFGARLLAAMMKTPEEAFEGAVIYISICGLGVPFIIAYNVLSAILRGDGNSRMPMVFVGVACIVNVIGDFTLTGILNMGVTGVAVSTVAAQIVASITGILYLKKKGLSFAFSRKFIKPERAEVTKILGIGFPIAAQDVLINFSFIAITIIANVRGITDASAVGVVEKLINLMFLFPSAMTSALSAITSQNIGAGKPGRAKQSVKYGMLLSFFFGVLCCGLSQIFHDEFASVFSNDPQVIIAAGQYLRTYTIDCILVSVTFCINGYLCGIGKSTTVFAHNALSAILIRVPAAMLFSKMFRDSMLPMGLASPLGSVFSIAFLGCYLLYRKKKTGSMEMD